MHPRIKNESLLTRPVLKQATCGQDVPERCQLYAAFDDPLEQSGRVDLPSFEAGVVWADRTLHGPLPPSQISASSSRTQACVSGILDLVSAGRSS